MDKRMEQLVMVISSLTTGIDILTKARDKELIENECKEKYREVHL